MADIKTAYQGQVFKRYNAGLPRPIGGLAMMVTYCLYWIHKQLFQSNIYNFPVRIQIAIQENNLLSSLRGARATRQSSIIKLHDIRICFL